ncbi:MAG TPA: myxosortase-dependent metalloprotease, MXAN_2677/MXAN_2678 family [Myxococcaceae bacterium]|nr:myxosortase-dependent metalloprotease, MXAN_2677/MXAN_2678 family [Myxococcaceae bacterium]
MRAAAAVLLWGLLLGQSPATQYVRTKTNDGLHCFRWPVSAGARGSVSFVQSTAGLPALGSGVFDAVSRSAQTWQAQLQACGNLDLVEGARSTSRAIGYLQGGPNENLTLFRTRACSAVVPSGDPCLAAGTCGNAYDCWDHADNIVALTTSSYVTSTGVLVDADVELNAATAFPTIVDSPPCTVGSISTSCVANDVQNAVTHELGHFLGLAHAPDSTSTMYANEPLGETSKRVLDPGSKQFVCDVYPAGHPSNDCALDSAGSSSSGCTSAPDAGGVTPLLALLLGGLAVRRRRGV